MMSIPRLITKMFQVGRAQRYGPDEIRRLQAKRLRRLLEHVLSRSRFYRAYYGKHGITRDHLDGITLRHLPPITKEMVMEHFDDLVCDPNVTRAGVERFLSERHDLRACYRGTYQVMITSGSTGAFGVFVCASKDWEWVQALIGTRVLRYRLHVRRPRQVFVLKIDGPHAGAKLCCSTPRVAYRQQVLPFDGPLDTLLAQIQQFRPHILGGYGSAVHRLAVQQRRGHLDIAPETVISSGEPLTDRMSQDITDAFGVRPLNLYAMSESLAIGVSCHQGKAIHLFDDWHCVEIVDSQGRPAEPGTSGHVRLTNLYNYTQPLIRYETTDEAILVDEPCPCGWPFPRVDAIAGRTEEKLWFERSDGTADYIHPFTIAGLHVPGLEKWQVVQSQPSELCVKCKVAGDPHEVAGSVVRELTRILKDKHLEHAVRLQTEIVDDIPNDPKTGKFRIVIPYQLSTPARQRQNGGLSSLTPCVPSS